MAYSGYVVVERFPFGSTSFSQCTVDQFTEDTITVTCPDMNDRVMDVFAPGTWRTVIAYDSLKHPIVTYTSKAERSEKRAALEAANAKYSEGATA